MAPFSLLSLPLMGFFYYWVSVLYLTASREMKRLESTTNSPIYAQFSETLMGVTTIRAYGSEKRSLLEIENKVSCFNIFAIYFLALY